MIDVPLVDDARCANFQRLKNISTSKGMDKLHKMKAILSMPHSFPQKSNNLDAGNSTGNLLLFDWIVSSKNLELAHACVDTWKS